MKTIILNLVNLDSNEITSLSTTIDKNAPKEACIEAAKEILISELAEIYQDLGYDMEEVDERIEELQSYDLDDTVSSYTCDPVIFNVLSVKDNNTEEIYRGR